MFTSAVVRRILVQARAFGNARKTVDTPRAWYLTQEAMDHPLHHRPPRRSPATGGLSHALSKDSATQTFLWSMRPGVFEERSAEATRTATQSPDRRSSHAGPESTKPLAQQPSAPPLRRYRSPGPTLSLQTTYYSSSALTRVTLPHPARLR